MCRMISASLAGVQPAIKRAISARGTLISASMRAYSRAGIRHRRFRHIEIERMRNDEPIQRVKLVAGDAIKLQHPAISDGQARLGIIRAVRHDQPGFRPRLDKSLLVDVALR